MRRCVTCLVMTGLVLLGAAVPQRLRAELAPSPPLAMDAALSHAKPTPGEVTLAVDAAKASLPKDAVLPGAPMTGREVGALYAQEAQLFGPVLAIAPPTVTVVYAPPDTPNPYDGMPPGQVMKLLTQTFTPAQWKAFLSPAGVGYTDMTSNAQIGLFQALFPNGHLEIIQDNPIGDNDSSSKREFSGDTLTAAHLRLGSMTSLALQSAEDPNSHTFGAGLRPANSPPRFFMTNAQTRDVDKEFGASVQETVPNTPKAGQIAWDDPALTAAVPLLGVKTVSDLMIRIGLTTHREIYADPRYGSRLVTLNMPSASFTAPAADLLRAAALCVGGTYRRVGPAFVLTDDTIGLGTKHVLWKEFEDKAARMLPGGDGFFPTAEPNPNIPYTVKDIPDSDDPLAFTKAQKESYWKKWAKNPGQSSNLSLDVTVPFSRLSPAQQEAAEMMQEDNEKRHFGTMLGGTVTVQMEPMVEVLLPSVSGPIEIFESYDGLLPYPALTPAEQTAQRKHFEMMDPELADPGTPAPDFTQTLRGFSRRAAQIPLPQTPKEARSALAALHALGFNEAWLQITPGPAASDGGAAARLAQVVAEGKKLGLRVLPDISLLHWGAGVFPEMLDRDIQGRTMFPRYNAQSPPTVSPFVPAAALRLSTLVRTLGSVPGIGGMVWSDILAVGYEKNVPGDTVFGGEEVPLGYSEAGRLAFLRLAHADPVDTQDDSFSDERAKIHVPGFDDDSRLESRLYTEWQTLRADTSQSFLHQIAFALPPPFTRAGVRPPLLLPPSNVTFVNSYGSWDAPSRAGPTVHFAAQTGPDGQPIMGAPSIERMSSALAYTKVSIYLPSGPSASAWKSAAARSLTQTAKLGARNVVVDLTGQPDWLK